MEIKFEPCIEGYDGHVDCVSDKDFNQWFDNKEFFMWTAGNYLDAQSSIETEEAMKQRMVYQLSLGTTNGVKSEVYFEVTMAEVSIKDESD